MSILKTYDNKWDWPFIFMTSSVAMALLVVLWVLYAKGPSQYVAAPLEFCKRVATGRQNSYTTTQCHQVGNNTCAYQSSNLHVEYEYNYSCNWSQWD